MSAALDAAVRGNHRKFWRVVIAGSGDFQPATSINIIEDVNWQTRGQVDMRVAGEVVSDARQSKKITIYLSTYVDDVLIDGAALDLGYFYIRSLVYDPATDETVIRAFTKECFLADARLTWKNPSVFSNYVSWVSSVIKKAIPSGNTIGVQSTVTMVKSVPGAPTSDEQTIQNGKTCIDQIDDVLRPKGAALYVDRNDDYLVGDTGFAEFGTVPVLTDTFGAPDSILKSAPKFIDRETWYNTVILRYWWDNGTASQNIMAAARIASTSPNAPAKVGLKVHYEEVNAGSTQAQANAAALDMLRSLVAKSQQMTVRAILCPWIRAGDPVRINGQDWRVLNINLDMASDEMTLKCELIAAADPIENYTP